MWNRREALRLIAGCAAAPFLARGQDQPRPNFVLLLADDLGYGDVGFNGRKDFETPNLDRLSGQGTIFNRWYTASPLGGPACASLLTGKYTIHNSVRSGAVDLPKSEVTIAEALKPYGYTSGFVGKWHRGTTSKDGVFTHPLDQGFDHFFGYLDPRLAAEHFPKTLFRGRDPVPVSGYSTDLIAEDAGKFIQANKGTPFFLFSSFTVPHFAIEAPEDEVARYRGKFKERNPAKPYNAIYAAMVHRLDACIGRIVKDIDDAGLAENTIIVFCSDNGATFEKPNEGASSYHDSNRPFRGQKRSLEEGGIRVPACVRWKSAVPAGKRSDDIVHVIDLLPSLMAAAGLAPDPAWKVDGENMVDVWTGRRRALERTLFWEWQTEGSDMYAAIRGEHKLLQIGANHFLYDVVRDPQERRNVAAEYPDVMRQLQAELKAWRATALQ